jgi:hypothetical protein
MGKVQISEASQVKQFMDKGATFMFIPSAGLVEMVAKNEHPFIKSMPYTFRYVIMRNEPIRIEGAMALHYYLGQLDIKNSFLFDRGDIKVIPDRFEINKIEEKE